MTSLDRTVRIAQRRLWLNRWLRALGWASCVTAGLYCVAVVPNRLFSWTDHPWFMPGAALGAVGAALIGSLVWLVVTREDRRIAATILDEAAGLKERISSGLYCSDSADPFAQAVRSDAERVSRSVSPRTHLRIRFPHSMAYALGLIVLAMLVSFLIPPLDLLGKQEERKVEIENREAVKRTEAVVRRTFEQVRKLADENPLLQKVEGLKNLDPEAETKAQSALDVKQDAIKKIDNLVKNLQEQRAQAEPGKLDAIKKMLRQASDLQQGRNTAMEKLNRALASGDFQAAREALKEIEEKLAQEPKTPEQQKQAEELRKQLAALGEKLDKAAAQAVDRKLSDELKKAGIDPKQIQAQLASMSKEDMKKLAEQLQKQGLSKRQAEELARKLQEQAKAAEACRKLGDGLCKAGRGGSRKGGDKPGGSGGGGAGEQGLAMADQQLSEMEQLQQNLDQLAAAMSELEGMKSDLGKPCDQCGGTGMCDGRPCSKCGGSGCRGAGSGGGMGGPGIGEGGIAPKAETGYKTRMQRAPVHTGKGSLIGQTWVDGEQIKGQAQSDFVETVISAQRDIAEAIHQEKIPRQYHKTVGEYFKRIADDAASSQSEPTPAGDAR